MATYYQAKKMQDMGMLDKEYGEVDPSSASGKSDQAKPRTPMNEGQLPAGGTAPPAGGGPVGEASPFNEPIGTETGQVPNEITHPRGLYQLHPPHPQEELIQKNFLEPRVGPRGLSPDTDQRVFEPEQEESDWLPTSIIPKSPVEIQQDELEAFQKRQEQFSFPGKLGPSPTNPLQQSQVWSSVITADAPGWHKFRDGQIIKIKNPVMGQGETRDGEGPYIDIPAGSSGVVQYQSSPGYIEILFPLSEEEQKRYPQVLHVICHVEPKDIDLESVNEDGSDPFVGGSDWSLDL